MSQPVPRRVLLAALASLLLIATLTVHLTIDLTVRSKASASAPSVSPARRAPASPTPPPAPAPTSRQPSALPHAPPALRAAYITTRQAEGAHDARFHARRDGAALLTTNTPRGITGRFDARGVELSAPSHPALTGRLDATELRCGARVFAITNGTPTLDATPNRVVLERSVATSDGSATNQHTAAFRLREWYANGPLGLEQGFDVTLPTGALPTGALPTVALPTVALPTVATGCDDELTIALATPGFAPTLDADGATVRLATLDGAHAFAYAELIAADATGRALPAYLGVSESRVTLAVDARGAQFPIAIDPLLYLANARVTADDAAPDDQFGSGIALSGTTAVIGAHFDDVGANVDQGSAYVFTRTGTTWTQQAKLIASDGRLGDEFGYRVALAGETVLVGAHLLDDGPGTNRGSAYVFTRTGTTWTQQARLMANDFIAGQEFGIAVALSGETALIGAHFDENPHPGQGAAYVFNRSGTNWTQQAKLTAEDGALGDHFGNSVALSGDTALIGAHSDDVGLAVDRGSAYVFTRMGNNWFQQANFVGVGGLANDLFGTSVALSGDTALVGSVLDDVGGNTNQGSAYVFTRSGTLWTQQAQLTAADGAVDDWFGFTVALSGDTALVGSVLDDVGWNVNQGSAYAYTRTGGAWFQLDQLLAADGAADDWFGYSVALSGTPAGYHTLVGELLHEQAPPLDHTNEGAAYFGQLLNSTGTACAAASECLTGNCVDGFCCNTACGADSMTDCMACSATLTGGASGSCLRLSGSVAPTVVCRAVGGVCDLPELCSSVSALCPPDVKVAASVACRASAGVCDLVDNCTGTANACPADAKLPAATVCRANSGLGCDVTESCTGTTDSCPTDSFAAAATSCRAAAGDCDVAEVCTGSSASCPVDAKVPATTECRASAGVCDLIEFCIGTSPFCPSDRKEAATAECRGAVGICDVAELCNGRDDGCPLDARAAFGTVCRVPAGSCDLGEYCTGGSNLCPADLRAPALTECRSSAGDCDLVERCTGTTTACPVDLRAPALTECRSSAGECDPAEFCPGDDDACPADVKAPATTLCRAATGDCDLADHCTGADNVCPLDAKADATTVCRAATGDCDLADHCTGTDDACADDALADTSTACRAASCDGGIETHAATCTGDDGLCPSVATVACDRYVCGPAACLADCTGDGECIATAHCVDGACAARLELAASCTEDRQCLAGNCVDGFCCDRACTGQCEACAAPGSAGVCTPTVGTPRGARAACASDGPLCGGACDGIDAAACAFPAVETECRAASCTAGVAIVAASCDGVGACPAEATVACAPFPCHEEGLLCDGGCTTHDECGGGRYCAAGSCAPTLIAGAVCAEAASCASGFCADGVCCDAECSGQCAACNEPGSEGACVAVTGAPRGGRIACVSDGSSCGGACNGTAVVDCAYPGDSTVCHERRCDSAMLIDVGTCDGAGACDDPPAMLCEHGCASSECVGCVTDLHCTAGEACAAGVCVPTPEHGGPYGCACRIAAYGDAPARGTLPALLGLGVAALLLGVIGVVIGRRRRRRVR